MSSIESSFEKSIITIAKEVKERLDRQSSVMKDCVEFKLQNTLTLYEEEFENTCNYILIRNPVLITKEIGEVITEKKKEEDYD